jgi:hypothetical protein
MPRFTELNAWRLALAFYARSFGSEAISLPHKRPWFYDEASELAKMLHGLREKVEPVM